MRKSVLISHIVFMIFMHAAVAFGCTVFRMPLGEPHVLIGRNFDWDYGHGLIAINKRGVAKAALGMHESDKIEWVSKFGSLTFNQVGLEMPYGGMNENGLMIEVLWLGYTAWPVTSAPSISEVQWIQYQLDTRSSVSDLVAHIDDVRILSLFARVHFFACDSTGACATVEGAGDHIEIHTGESMPLAALANDPYKTSDTYTSQFLQQPNGCGRVPHTMHSNDRFARAVCAAGLDIENESVADETARANEILDNVAEGDFTKWRIVYDLTSKSISIRTQTAPLAKTVRLAAFDFSCSAPAKVLDINAVLNSRVDVPSQMLDVPSQMLDVPSQMLDVPSQMLDVPSQVYDVSSQFVDFTRGLNRSIVEASLLNGFAHLEPSVVENIVKFPESMTCTGH